MVQKTFFAIVFVGRQGSSFLEGLLDSHPNVRCEGELFAPTGRYFSTCRHQDFGRYLEECLHSSSRKVVGFKMPWMSLLDHPEAWEVLESFGYKLILLTRENLLDQYISMMLAKKNNAWRSDYGRIKIKQFQADFDEAESHFRSWAGQNAMLGQALKSHPSIHITYEQLLEGEGVATVLNFLGLPPAQLESRFKRQRSGSQSEIIQNYAEMKAHFARTRWARHFVDTAVAASSGDRHASLGPDRLARFWAFARLNARFPLQALLRLKARSGGRSRS